MCQYAFTLYQKCSHVGFVTAVACDGRGAKQQRAQEEASNLPPRPPTEFDSEAPTLWLPGGSSSAGAGSNDGNDVDNDEDEENKDKPTDCAAASTLYPAVSAHACPQCRVNPALALALDVRAECEARHGATEAVGGAGWGKRGKAARGKLVWTDREAWLGSATQSWRDDLGLFVALNARRSLQDLVDTMALFRPWQVCMRACYADRPPRSGCLVEDEEVVIEEKEETEDTEEGVMKGWRWGLRLLEEKGEVLEEAKSPGSLKSPGNLESPESLGSLGSPGSPGSPGGTSALASG